MGGYFRPVSGQRLCKHVPAATVTPTTGETGYCLRGLRRGVKKKIVEAGSNTSTVTLRVVGGDQKGSLESETVKYGHESYGTRTRK
jgi:hypothetical protein